MRRFSWLLLAMVPGLALAHPVDEVVQSAYLTLAPDEVRLELDLTPGTEVAGALFKPLDANADSRITETEARAFALKVLEQSTLTLDRAALSWTLDSVSVPPYRNLELGADTVKIFASTERPENTGPRTLRYQNNYQPANSRWTANVFLQPAKGWHYQVTGQKRSNHGRELLVNYAVTRP